MGNELVFEAQHEQLDANDARWEQQVQSLLADLKAHVGSAKREAGAAEPGKKGFDASQIILALGSAGVVTAAVQVFSAWLKRDKKRSLRIKTSDDSIVITGDMSEEMFAKALEAAQRKQAGG